MAEVDEALWVSYRKGEPGAYDTLVEAYLPLVKITVGRMAMNLPSFIDYEELYSIGCVGLLDAIEKYDPGRAAKFTTYAITRIRGAVIDELRSHDLLGRVTRDRVTRIRRAEKKLLAEGTPPSPQDIAEETGLTLDEYYDAVRGDRASRMISLSEISAESDSDQSLLEVLVSKGVTSQQGMALEDVEILDAVTEMLGDREKMLVVLYYHEELTLKEIGSIMGVSESRVSQIHTEMLERVRNNLKILGID